jgi:hypothetical protein
METAGAVPPKDTRDAVMIPLLDQLPCAMTIAFLIWILK